MLHQTKKYPLERVLYFTLFYGFWNTDSYALAIKDRVLSFLMYNISKVLLRVYDPNLTFYTLSSAKVSLSILCVSLFFITYWFEQKCVQIIPIDPSNIEDVKFWQVHNPLVLAIAQGSPEGRDLAYICQNFTCYAPVDNVASLQQLLQTSATPNISSFKLGSGIRPWS